MNDQIKDTFSFSVSDQAAERIAKIIETEQGSYFRISVLGGGCSGFQYKFSIDDEKTDDDIVLNNSTSTGINVITLIDSMSLELITGGQLDFVNELAGQYFQVNESQCNRSMWMWNVFLRSDPFTIATWNVNSIKVRADAVLDWLKQGQCDILLMQELKCIDENFPGDRIS